MGDAALQEAAAYVAKAEKAYVAESIWVYTDAID
jgi:hypothetical protein